MSLIRRTSSALAAAIALLVWTGPLPSWASQSFAAHMTMHIAIVAIVAPLTAFAIAGTRADPVKAMPRLMAPLPMSLVELVVVWAWHVPALHHAAREHPAAFALEQASFLVVGALLWMSAVGGDREQRRLRAGPGVAALLVTSMHMTLLGALFALTNRPLYQHGDVASSAAAVADQQLGGVIMLLVGGAVYLAGGLWLTALALRSASGSATPRAEHVA